MLVRNCGITDTVARQSCIHDEFACEIALRALKGRPCAWVFQRLLCLSSDSVIIHLCLDLPFLLRVQFHGSRQYDGTFFHHAAVPVRKIQIFCMPVLDPAVCAQDSDLLQDILHFSAISAGIHAYGSADRARDPCRKCQSTQSVLQCRISHLGQERSRFCPNLIALDRDSRRLFAKG